MMQKLFSQDIRFKNNKGNDYPDWEKMRFYDLLNEVLDFRGRTPKKLGMDWGGGEIISLSANNVKNGHLDLDAECNLGSEKLHKKWMGKVNLEPNDIVFTMEAPLGNALLVPDSKKYILSQRVVAFKTKDEVSKKFLIQLIWTQNFQNKIHRLSTGSTAKGINQRSLKKVFVKTPLKKEQQKIAEFLSSVDTKIEQLNKKKTLLEQYKKGMVQKLFSQDIRFKNNKGNDYPDWEEIKLGDIAPLQRGFDLPTTQVNEGDYPVVYSNGVLRTHKEFKVTGPGVVTGRSGTIGKVSFVEDNYWPHNTSLWVTDFCGNAPRFIYYLYNQIRLERYNAGSTVPTLNRNDVHTIKALIPQPQEQIKIASFLSAIDKKIELVSTEREQAQIFKKGLLQQMFV